MNAKYNYIDAQMRANINYNNIKGMGILLKSMTLLFF